MRVHTHLLAIAALAVAACASSAQTADTTTSAGRDCFRAASVSGYSIIDDHNIRARINPSRSYTLNTTWNARDLDWTTAIVLRSRSDWICTGSGLGVEVVGGTQPRTYPINSITRDPEPPADQQGS